MKCHQCERPALYVIEDGKVPLCLHCYSLWQQQQDVEFLKNAMLMNQAMDQMDIVSGFYTPGGRMPVHELAKAIMKSPTLNNIVVSKSQIGVLNTGSIQKIDAAITLSQGSETEVVTDHIKRLTEAVIGSDELDDVKKNEVIELTESLSEQVVGPRKIATITALVKAIREKVGGTLALSNAAEGLWNVLKNTFNF